MKRLLTAVAAGSLVVGTVVALGAVAGASTTTTTAAPTTTTTLAAPLQGNSALPLALTVDTVVASGSPNLAYPLAGCAMTNEFIVGQTVVFRMWGQDSATGGTPLTGANVASAVITIPGDSTPVTMAYGNHGSVAYWTGAWKTAGYSTLGAVAFTLTVKTIAVPAVTKVVRKTVDGKTTQKRVIVKPAVIGQTQTYTQAGLPDPLTLNAVPA